MFDQLYHFVAATGLPDLHYPLAGRRGFIRMRQLTAENGKTFLGYQLIKIPLQTQSRLESRRSWSNNDLTIFRHRHAQQPFRHSYR